MASRNGRGEERRREFRRSDDRRADQRHRHGLPVQEMTARQAVFARHQAFVAEFEQTFGPEWTRTIWRAVEQRMRQGGAE